jgi:hypothetical protein
MLVLAKISASKNTEVRMKQAFTFFVLFAVLSLAAAAAQTPAAELTFSFTRQSGAASNQFAVWIEDSQGQYIKTIYATRYTANGGWKQRETSIPQWVKKSSLSVMTKVQVDALTGATPRTGTLTYRWDGTDSKGAVLPVGNYVICLEGTLRWANQVLYRAPIRTGQGLASAEVSVVYTGTTETERSMITAVTARVLR